MIRALCTCLAVVLPTAVLPAQQVFVVDRANRPGTTHTDIQAAVNVAAPGDRIVVRRDGSVPYAGFSLTKGLDIRGDDGEPPEVVRATVSAIPAGQFVTIEHLDFRASALPAAIDIRDCTGTVTLRRVVGMSDGVSTNAPPALSIQRCDLVIHEAGKLITNQEEPATVTDSNAVFRGVHMINRSVSTIAGVQGDPGLVVTSSAVTLHDSAVTGGAGVPGIGNPFGRCFRDGTRGSPAVVAQASDVLVTGASSLIGGPGGWATGTCRPGPRGASWQGREFRMGPAVQLIPSIFPRIAQQPALRNVPSVLAPGTSSSIDLAAEGPAVWGLFVDLDAGRVPLTGVHVPFQLGPNATPILYGSMPASGAVSFPLQIPASPSLIEKVLWFQAGVLRTTQDLRISNVASMRVR